MRLIIIDDKLIVLKQLKYILKDLENNLEIILVHCQMNGDNESGNESNQNIYVVKTKEDLCKLCQNTLKFEDNDYYLVDVTLFGEDQVDLLFSQYGSVEFANYLADKKSEKLKLKFYTRPDGISIQDFANETNKWDLPIYRPELSKNSLEKDAKASFYTSVKEFCNV